MSNAGLRSNYVSRLKTFARVYAFQCGMLQDIITQKYAKKRKEQSVRELCR